QAARSQFPARSLRPAAAAVAAIIAAAQVSRPPAAAAVSAAAAVAATHRPAAADSLAAAPVQTGSARAAAVLSEATAAAAIRARPEPAARLRVHFRVPRTAVSTVWVAVTAALWLL